MTTTNVCSLFSYNNFFYLNLPWAAYYIGVLYFIVMYRACLIDNHRLLGFY